VNVSEGNIVSTVELIDTADEVAVVTPEGNIHVCLVRSGGVLVVTVESFAPGEGTATTKLTLEGGEFYQWA
jgi:hypothetical protein